MKIKTAIIILASLAIATGLFFVYLYVTINKVQPQPVIKTISTEKRDPELAPGKDEVTEIEAAKQKIMEERKLEITNNLKSNVGSTTVEETPKEKTEKINKMMEILTR
ncbi:MAG: hypothetical protein Q7T50_00380 [Candidatus Magasanikbacteria bacterium]|nr:hypothetical protein [Candidatus Magasanikbacteria bacterium]